MSLFCFGAALLRAREKEAEAKQEQRYAELAAEYRERYQSLREKNVSPFPLVALRARC
mgnify:CR=1 FL=1